MSPQLLHSRSRRCGPSTTRVRGRAAALCPPVAAARGDMPRDGQPSLLIRQPPDRPLMLSVRQRTSLGSRPRPIDPAPPEPAADLRRR